ncbi:MAG: hypothetical protein ABIZ80_03855 [Bryobacteraceae bacterium]
MRTLLSNGFFVFAAIIATREMAVSPEHTPAPEYYSDPRLDLLQKFFQAWNCPAQDFSEQFLRSADEHNLDWRLLPSISVVELGGGRDAPNNNMFGWDNGRAAFPSISAGIEGVASRLKNSKLYRDKDLDELL